MFGVVPHWTDTKLARQTYDARTETVANKPSFRSAWKRKQFCIIPAANFFEHHYETGKPVRWRIERADGAPVAIAGIWEYRPAGQLLSFSMLTINADGHSLMQRFHKPDDEKRMVMILDPEQYQGWLDGSLVSEEDVYRQYPADLLIAQPDPLPLGQKRNRWRRLKLRRQTHFSRNNFILPVSCFGRYTVQKHSILANHECNITNTST